MRRALQKTLETLAVLLILGTAFYPVISDAWNRRIAQRMIVQYRNSLWEKISEKDLGLERERAAEYNRKLSRSGIMGELTQEQEAEYEQLLNTDGTGIMGYLEIPAISVNLPIYHGTSDEALARGVGHLKGSSLPVGGAGTRTVLSGHRGLPSARLFTDLDQLKEGDVFYIATLSEKKTYKVIEIQTVLPEETEELEIEGDLDLATLVTCTPYGVNTHRLLVTGSRVAAGTEGSECGRSEGNAAGQNTEGQKETEGGLSRIQTVCRGIQKAMMRPALVLVTAGLVISAGALRILWIWTVDLGRWNRYQERMRKHKKMYEGGRCNETGGRPHCCGNSDSNMYMGGKKSVIAGCTDRGAADFVLVRRNDTNRRSRIFRGVCGGRKRSKGQNGVYLKKRVSNVRPDSAETGILGR